MLNSPTMAVINIWLIYPKGLIYSVIDFAANIKIVELKFPSVVPPYQLSDCIEARRHVTRCLTTTRGVYVIICPRKNLLFRKWQKTVRHKTLVIRSFIEAIIYRAQYIIFPVKNCSNSIQQ